MKNKIFLWFAMFSLTFLITSVAYQYFMDMAINPTYILGLTIGIILIFSLSTLSTKHSVFIWIRTGIVVISLPIILVGLISLIASVLTLELPSWFVFVVYILGVLAISLALIHRGIKYFFKEPMIDERNILHLAWSGLVAYFSLTLLILGAILQPWIALDQISLWITILILSFLLWIISLVLFEKVK